MRLTFLATTAALDRSLEFISIHHPVVRAAVAEEEASDRPPTGHLRFSADGTAAGPRFFFVFRLNVGGLKRRLEFVPVVVRPDGAVDERLGETFLARLNSAERATGDVAALVTDQAVEATAGVARGVNCRGGP